MRVESGEFKARQNHEIFQGYSQKVIIVNASAVV